MLRLRRYRVFLAFAVLTVLAFYKFSGSSSWQPSALDSYRNTNSNVQPAKEKQKTQTSSQKAPALHEVVKETKRIQVQVPLAETSRAVVTPPPLPPISKPAQRPPPAPLTTERPTKVDQNANTIPDAPLNIHEHGQGREEVDPIPTTAEVDHWKPVSEHYPVPSGSTIQLPHGSPKPIPKIQFGIKKETDEQKTDRLAKLTTIREHFSHSWKGYREKAWLHDELSPVSGRFRDPFAGWGATLVDALDTLWIMGLKKEFEEAVEGLKKIDFTTTSRADIPLFETTIRYLGGLLAAFDISGKQYPTLLEKAVELGDILVASFDTPNRMPMTYYYWRPAFSSQSHRAGSRVVLAEIGSLSMEFTRLSQLTKEPKYYDAIARITDYFEEWQNSTRLPGMWPTYLDASGCKKPDYKPISVSQSNQPILNEYGTTNGAPVRNEPAIAKEKAEAADTIKLKDPVIDGKPDIDETGHLRYPKIEQVKDNAANMVPVNKPKPLQFKGGIKGWDDSHKEKQKRQLEDSPQIVKVTSDTAPLSKAKKDWTETQCDTPGFYSSSEFGSETFSLGGMSDSTYEYLPKEYLLLGGLVEKYRTMYEYSADTAAKYLVYRPMVPKGDDILFAGNLNTGTEAGSSRMDYENAHLTCFAGGMFAMGAKIFDREADLEIGRKLTEGCIWSYKVTGSGIMPESFNVVPCKNKAKCEWNQTAYWQELDPWAESRQKTYEDQMETYRSQVREAMAEASLAAKREKEAEESARAAQAALLTAKPAEATPTPNAVVEEIPRPVQKRQLEDSVSSPADVATPTTPKATKKTTDDDDDSLDFAEGFPIPSNIWKPQKPQTHEQKVRERIEQERLPEGMIQLGSRKYILRPEAIESVFYMYRITGEQHWRDAGWRMFQAVAQHTRAAYGHSALDDITKEHPEQLDEMESFWLAETLKYFYLLFESEDVVSLDDWVLNTEAHPFKRPKKLVGE